MSVRSSLPRRCFLRLFIKANTHLPIVQPLTPPVHLQIIPNGPLSNGKRVRVSTPLPENLETPLSIIHEHVIRLPASQPDLELDQERFASMDVGWNVGCISDGFVDIAGVVGCITASPGFVEVHHGGVEIAFGHVVERS